MIPFHAMEPCGASRPTHAIEACGPEHPNHVCTVEEHPEGADPAEELHICGCGANWPLEDQATLPPPRDPEPPEDDETAPAADEAPVEAPPAE